jgi:Flp pilus assembly pilin Flp
MRNSQHARSLGKRAIKRGSGHTRGKKDRWNELGASLAEYALVVSLVAVVAIGALVYLGHSVGKTLNTVAVAVTADPAGNAAPPVVNAVPSASPASGASCGTNGSALTGFCASFTWLVGMYYFPPPNGPWTLITSGNAQSVFSAATSLAPPAWTCSDPNGSVCTTIATPSGTPPVPYELGNGS